MLVEVLLDGEERRLQVERVERRLRQEDVGAAVDQAAHLFVVRVDELVEGHRRGTPGCSTSGESDAVRFVGPIAPATKRGRSGVEYASAARRASCAAARLIS